MILALEAGLDPSRTCASTPRTSRAACSRRRARANTASPLPRDRAPLRERYFAEKDGVWRISDDVKQHVDFIHLNLLDRSRVALLGAMDVMLCRNVIIYFDVEASDG